MDNIEYEITNTLKTKGQMTVAQLAFLIKVPMSEVAIHILNNLHFFKINTFRNANSLIELNN